MTPSCDKEGGESRRWYCWLMIGGKSNRRQRRTPKPKLVCSRHNNVERTVQRNLIPVEQRKLLLRMWRSKNELTEMTDNIKVHWYFDY
mmetsp:Transcript_3500/g.5111  ORF Transcript_3500/g.5111 Transcript_3500/m.5111 type:complete len:88 (+) Transcript_3500:159-422(+)